MSLTKSLRRLIVKLVVIIVLVLIILIAGGILFIDHIVKAGIVKGVPAVLGKDVTASVEHLHIAPYNGRVEVGDLIIGNPEGYDQNGYAFKLGEVVADVDLGTVTKDKIRIEQLTLKDIDVVYERGWTSSNLEEILSRLDKGEKEEKEKEKEKEKKDDKDKKEKRFQFDLIEIENVGVSLKIKGVSGKARIPITIDPLKDLGTDEEGISTTDLAYEILGAIIRKALALDAVTDALNAAGEAVSKAVSNVTGAAKDAASNAVSNVNDAANKTTDSLKETGSNLSNTATEAGKSFTEGINNTAQNLSNTASEAGKNFSQGVGNALGGLGLGGGKKTEEETPAQPQGN